MCFKRKKDILTEIESLRLRISGMRCTRQYEVICNKSEAAVFRYEIKYVNRTEICKLDKKAICELDEILNLLNNCNIIAWDGFHGSHPRNVLDGDMFRLHAVVNGKKIIQAEGSANFPNGYRELVSSFDRILSESICAEDGKP